MGAQHVVGSVGVEVVPSWAGFAEKLRAGLGTHMKSAMGGASVANGGVSGLGTGGSFSARGGSAAGGGTFSGSSFVGGASGGLGQRAQQTQTHVGALNANTAALRQLTAQFKAGGRGAGGGDTGGTPAGDGEGEGGRGGRGGRTPVKKSGMWSLGRGGMMNMMFGAWELGMIHEAQNRARVAEMMSGTMPEYFKAQSQMVQASSSGFFTGPMGMGFDFVDQTFGTKFGPGQALANTELAGGFAEDLIKNRQSDLEMRAGRQRRQAYARVGGGKAGERLMAFSDIISGAATETGVLELANRELRDLNERNFGGGRELNDEEKLALRRNQQKIGQNELLIQSINQDRDFQVDLARNRLLRNYEGVETNGLMAPSDSPERTLAQVDQLIKEMTKSNATLDKIEQNTAGIDQVR